MKRLLLLFLLNASFVISYSQTQGVQNYTAFDNTVFKVGDSITIGLNSGYKEYKYVTEQYYNDQYDKGVRHVKSNIYNTKHQILRITKDYTAIWDTSAYVADIGVAGFLKGYKYFVNINKALISGEIMLSKSPTSKNKVSVFNDSIAFIYKIKQSPKPISDFALEYLFRFNKSIYNKYKQDEFELDNQKQIATEIIKNNISTTEDSTSYFCGIEIDIDNYDFSTNSFPLGGYFDSYTVITGGVLTEFPQTKIVFINTTDFSRVIVDKAVANSLIKRRKDSSGNVNRKIYANVYFKNIRLPENSQIRNSYPTTDFKDYIYAEIYRMEFFDTSSRVYNYLGHIN